MKNQKAKAKNINESNPISAHKIINKKLIYGVSGAHTKRRRKNKGDIRHLPVSENRVVTPSVCVGVGVAL